MEDFLKQQMFKQSPKAKLIVNAKLEAMKIVELLLNKRFNTRLYV